MEYDHFDLEYWKADMFVDRICLWMHVSALMIK